MLWYQSIKDSLRTSVRTPLDQGKKPEYLQIFNPGIFSVLYITSFTMENKNCEYLRKNLLRNHCRAFYFY